MTEIRQTSPDAVEFQREWIVREGVRNGGSLVSALMRISDLRFKSVNDAIKGSGGKAARPGLWVLADISPGPEPGWWYTAVLEFGGMLVTSRVPSPAQCIPAVLERLGVGVEVRFQAKAGTASVENPWLRETARDSVDRRPVYLICAANGLIKIGVSGDPRERLHTLQTMSPVELRLAAVLPGAGAQGEATLHERFAADRSHGEWFRPSPDLLAYIAEHAEVVS